ncbi:MAG: hypothetical protein GXP18_00660 [Gammaproteobacteria bacterium]|nr:hypothetical protein [Gammaproteobacteria bacterium]
MFYMLNDTTRKKRLLDISDYLDCYGFRSSYGTTFKWFRGSRFTESPPEPFEIKLLPYDAANPDQAPLIPSYYDHKIVLMRDDLIAAMEAFGVDNLDKYTVNLTDPDDGTVYTNYKAVNIIGVVAAADMGKSQSTVHNSIPLVDVSFDKLVIDEIKVQDLLLFRLAENLMTILIHESLRNYLLEKGFDDIKYYQLDEVATP